MRDVVIPYNTMPYDIAKPPSNGWEMDLTGEIERRYLDLQPVCRKWFHIKTLWLNQNHRFLGSHPSATEVNEPRRISFRIIIPKIVSIWFSHELCLGVYTNRIRWLFSDQERLPARYRFQHPTHSLLPQRLLDPARLGDHFHQSLRAMDVPIIHHENPRGRRVGGHRLLDVAAKSASVRVGPIVGAINSPVATAPTESSPGPGNDDQSPIRS